MTKVLHISDLHYAPKHLAWVDKAVSFAIETAIREGCALAIISGDSFDHALEVHEPAVSAYVRQVVTLAGFMPVIVLQGTHSHDRPGCLDVLKAIPAKHEIVVADMPTQYTLAGCTVSCLPSINKADTAFDLDAALAGFAADKGSGMPHILTAHGTVTGCVTESNFAMVSPDHEFSLELLATAEADAVMLGHIHKHQAWPDIRTPAGAATTIAYAGSITRLTHGHTDPAGFLIWDVEPGAASFRFFEAPSRQLRHIEFSGPPDMAALRKLAKEVGPDDAVRVRFEVDEEFATSVDKAAIRALFAGAGEVKLEGRVLPVQRVRAEGIGRAVTLADKLTHWAKATGSEHALPGLLDKLARLQG